MKVSKEIKEYDFWNKKRYAERDDKGNIFPIGLTDEQFVEWVKRIFLGDNWYVSSPLSKNQINEEILEELIYQKCEKGVNER